MKKEYEHGTRKKYVRDRCRCDKCREANRLYARDRNQTAKELARSVKRSKVVFVERTIILNGKEVVQKRRACLGLNGQKCPYNSHIQPKRASGDLCCRCREKLISKTQLVSAKKAREHLIELQKQGVGARTVERKTGLVRSTLHEIRCGNSKRIDRDTERAILDVVFAYSNRTFWPAEPTWRLISEIVNMGYPLHEISKMLGYANYGIQIRVDRVQAKSALKVLSLYKGLIAEQEEMDALDSSGLQRTREDTACNECGLSHAKPERLKLLKRMLPCTSREVWESYSCIYPYVEYKTPGLPKEQVRQGKRVQRQLIRDLKEVAFQLPTEKKSTAGTAWYAKDEVLDERRSDEGAPGDPAGRAAFVLDHADGGAREGC